MHGSSCPGGRQGLYLLTAARGGSLRNVSIAQVATLAMGLLFVAVREDVLDLFHGDESLQSRVSLGLI